MASGVSFVCLLCECGVGHIHLAAYDEAEVAVFQTVDPVLYFCSFGFVAGFLGFFKFLFVAFECAAVDIVVDLFDAEHVAMIGDSQSGHAVG